MKVFILLCCLVAVALATPTKLELNSKWHQFKSTHNKKYESVEEEQKRIEIFNENVKKIEEHNKLYEQGLVSYKMAVNKFADWSHDEFVSFLKKSKRSQRKSVRTFARPLNVQLPSEVDWRDSGVVTPVKDQGQCGSCWSFSTTGSLEGQNALKTGQLVSFSEQELIDCSFENAGCSGGLMDPAFEYIMEYGLTTEEEYPYEERDARCRRSGTSRAVRAVGYTDILYRNETDLEAAVATVGPISIAVDAANWSFYAEGLYSGYCGSSLNSLDHGVLAVGYGTDSNGRDYWIIKNSWGPSWGEEGYIRVARHQNKCGVATEASYPLL